MVWDYFAMSASAFAILSSTTVESTTLPSGPMSVIDGIHSTVCLGDFGIAHLLQFADLSPFHPVVYNIFCPAVVVYVERHTDELHL